VLQFVSDETSFAALRGRSVCSIQNVQRKDFLNVSNRITPPWSIYLGREMFSKHQFPVCRRISSRAVFSINLASGFCGEGYGKKYTLCQMLPLSDLRTVIVSAYWLCIQIFTSLFSTVGVRLAHTTFIVTGNSSTDIVNKSKFDRTATAKAKQSVSRSTHLACYVSIGFDTDSSSCEQYIVFLTPANSLTAV